MNSTSFFKFFAIIAFCIFIRFNSSAGDIVLRDRVNIYTDAQPGSAIAIALNALKRDFKDVLNAEVAIKAISAINESGIVILDNAEQHAMPKTISGWEAHRVYVKSINNIPQVVLEGADMRGSIYAIYTFSEKILGVPPLWYFSSWQPIKKDQINIKADINFNLQSPTVKYRAWFPNDTDLFEPWRKQSADHYELWLETVLRLKLNTIEWFDDERDYAKSYSISKTTKLINDYGLINTTHHHSPLNASFAGWNDYWKKVKHTDAPELSLANIGKLEEFWRYNIESIVRNNIDMLWVLGFRGNGDHPFWYSFNDAPESMQERGAVISKMMERQRQILVEITKNPNPPIRTIFYDELSDLLAKGFIEPPADTSFIWTYVASRRDHFPNLDIQSLDQSKNLRLGYYFNYQFTSTGSHLTPAEGPWKMERNYRYVATKSKQPIAFSVVNAGNLREHLMELSANAAMMWSLSDYRTDKFLKEFSGTYYGVQNAKKVAKLYKQFYNSYWNQRKTDLPNFERQYIFQDLRYNKALKDIAAAYHKPYTANPLMDIGAEQVKNRTYNIVPEDNQAPTILDALINGTTKSAKDFYTVAYNADKIYKSLRGDHKVFFNDNLRQYAWYMHHLNQSLLYLTQGYREKDTPERTKKVLEAISELVKAQKALHATQHGEFDNWYMGDKVFGLNSTLEKLRACLKSN